LLSAEVDQRGSGRHGGRAARATGHHHGQGELDDHSFGFCLWHRAQRKEPSSNRVSPAEGSHSEGRGVRAGLPHRLSPTRALHQETDGRNREDRNGVLPDLQHPPARPDRPPPRGQAQNRDSCQSSLCEFSRLVGVACSLRSTRFSPTS
jgi:hypothetical protein